MEQKNSIDIKLEYLIQLLNRQTLDYRKPHANKNS